MSLSIKIRRNPITKKISHISLIKDVYLNWTTDIAFRELAELRMRYFKEFWQGIKWTKKIPFRYLFYKCPSCGGLETFLFIEFFPEHNDDGCIPF